jgi:hypothetical protein
MARVALTPCMDRGEAEVQIERLKGLQVDMNAELVETTMGWAIDVTDKYGDTEELRTPDEVDTYIDDDEDHIE